MEKKTEKKSEDKVTIKGWLSLLVLVMILSGVFKDVSGPLAAFDFNNLMGKFGAIVDGIDFTGKGGSGVRDGFIAGLVLVPSVMFSTALVATSQSMGAMKAAGVLFQPILKPIIGIPGESGLAFVSSFTGSDVAAVLTKDLYEEGYMTDDERTIFVAYQYAASAPVNNTINGGAPLLLISLFAFAPIFLIEFVSKILGANIVRAAIYLSNKRGKNKEAANG